MTYSLATCFTHFTFNFPTAVFIFISLTWVSDRCEEVGSPSPPFAGIVFGAALILCSFHLFPSTTRSSTPAEDKEVLVFDLVFTSFRNHQLLSVCLCFKGKCCNLKKVIIICGCCFVSIFHFSFSEKRFPDTRVSSMSGIGLKSKYNEPVHCTAEGWMIEFFVMWK